MIEYGKINKIKGKGRKRKKRKRGERRKGGKRDIEVTISENIKSST